MGISLFNRCTQLVAGHVTPALMVEYSCFLPVKQAFTDVYRVVFAAQSAVTVTVTVAGAVGLTTGSTGAEGTDAGGFGAGAGAAGALPTNHVCSGVNKGGAQGVLLTKPSAFSVRHWFPGPTPLLTEFWTIGKPMPPERLALESKKNC